MKAPVLLAGFLALLCLQQAEARVNATGALEVFLISDCATCTKDKNSIFCSEAKGGDNDNWVYNGTIRVTIGMKKTQSIWSGTGTALGPADGAKFCWSGTFGKLTNFDGNFTDLLGSPSVLCKLDCDQTNLYYRQCVIPAQMAIILMTIAAIIFVTFVITIFFCCGCCKCLNEPGDDSKYGMCNRFCPFCTICADKHLRKKDAPVIVDGERSLTGKSDKLNSDYAKNKALAGKEGDEEEGVSLTGPAKKGAFAPQEFSSPNPLAGRKL